MEKRTYVMKRIGPKTKPWGTPEVTGNRREWNGLSWSGQRDMIGTGIGVCQRCQVGH